MPWCDGCSRFYNPNSLRSDGTCPSCGTKLAVPRVERREEELRRRRAARSAEHAPPGSGGADPAGQERDRGRGVPWHFWVLVIALVIYLSYRFFQGIVWVVHKL